jgi:amino acid adenylation domain-containing protein
MAIGRSGYQRVEALFCRRAPQWRDRVALSLGERRITYGELDAGSNRLARRLIASGVARSNVVAVATGDIEVFAFSLLAILKAGGTYLPIDARRATDRVRDILLDAAPRLLLADADFPEALVPKGVTLLRDITDPGVLSGFADDALTAAGDSDDAACIYYTSGSTGRPKGIAVAHRGIPLLVGDHDFVPFGPEDRIAQAANFGFDATAFEVWGALLNGACLVNMPTRCLYSASEIGAFIARERISVCFLTTSLFNALAAQDPGGFGSLKHLLIGGEAAEPHAVGRVLNSASPPARLLNAYGPTEATTFSAWHEVTPSDAADGCIPIGRPVRGMILRIVDDCGAPAQAGKAGELLIGGPGVANGYLGLPAVTAERFVRLNGEGDGRFYRSGDLCRRREDGVLEYLGRIDDQVKIRGFRVEPADVAAALRGISGVDDAIVLARDAAFGTRELVAFVRGEGLPPMDRLRRDVAERVPDYMTPALIRPIAEVPLTPNGKLDRQRLLELAREGPFAGTRIGSSDGLEGQVASIFGLVLQRADIPPDIDFRDLGGDSLSTLNLALEVEQAFGHLPSIDELAAPLTVRTLAQRIALWLSKSQSEAAGCGERKADAKVFAVTYPWSMAQMPEVIGQALPGGQWKHLQVPLNAFRASTDPSIEDMAAILERQLLSQEPDGPYVLYGHCFCGLLAYELARRLIDSGHAVPMLVIVDSYPASPKSSAAMRRRLRRFLTLDWRARAEAVRKAILPASPTTLEEFVKQACSRAASRFHPEPYNGRLVFFRHNHEPGLTHHDQAAWRRLTLGDYSEHIVEFHEQGAVTGRKVQEGYQRIAEILKSASVPA